MEAEYGAGVGVERLFVPNGIPTDGVLPVVVGERGKIGAPEVAELASEARSV